VNHPGRETRRVEPRPPSPSHRPHASHTLRGVRSLTLDLDGPVHVADFGGTGRTMVLVHGLGGSHANWAAVAPALAAHARVLAPDLAGFGRTPLAGRSAEIQANHALLDRVLDTIADGPVILVGNSMGGLLAMLEAASHPDKVAALVLVGPAQPRPRGALPTWVDPGVAALFTAYAFPGVGERLLRWRADRLGPEGLVRQTLAFCCADPTRLPPDVVALHVALARERLERMPWANAAFLQAARSMLALLLRPRGLTMAIRRIAAAALIVQGTHDRLVPLAASRALAALRPDWSLAVFDGVGHVPQLEVPERFVTTLVDWLHDSPAVSAAS
jgi:pimeloyl-ACP methyl ester carboxylesterase